MIIIIDGYNALKQTSELDVSSQERTHYINELKQYSKKKVHHIVVVFDGGFSDWPHQEKRGTVTVIYSGYRETADDAIKRFLEKNRHKELLLVTADRQLVDFGRHLNVIAIKPQLFAEYIEQALQPSDSKKIAAAGKTIKLQTSSGNSDLDAIMHAGAQLPYEKIHEKKKQARTSKAMTTSKKKRKLLDTLKKL